MMEIELLAALQAVVETLIFVSLVYFLYLVVKHGELPYRTGHEGEHVRTALRPDTAALCRGEAEHGLPGGNTLASRVFDLVPTRFRDSA